jgi:arsenite methyltransferase
MEGHAFATGELTIESYGGAALTVIERYVAQQGSPDVEAWKAEQEELGRRGEFYFACIQACFSATKPA